MNKLLMIVVGAALLSCNRGPGAEAYFNEANKGLDHHIPYHAALADYNKAIELKPDFAIAFANRGRLLIKMHNFYGALLDLQKASAMDHKLRGLSYYTGYAKGQVGDQQGALLAFSKAIAEDPKDVRAYIGRALARQNMQDTGGALEDFSRALALKPDSLPDVYTARAMLKIRLKDKKGGCEDLHHAYTLKPDSATLHAIAINCH
jgi:tetratricopeptide (TPR) repeat protein